MVAKTVYVILLIFVVLVVIVPLLLNALGIPIGPGGGGSGGSSIIGTARNGILLRSPDGGQNWQAAEFNRDNKPALPSEILDMAFYPVRSNSPEATAVAPTAQRTSNGVNPIDANVLFAGTRGSGLWKSEDAGAVWKKVNDADHILQAGADVYKIAMSRGKPAVMYLAVMQDRRGRVLRSEDAGASWREIYAVTQDGLGVFDLYTSPTLPDDIMIATGEGRLLVSQDAGIQWRIVRSETAPLMTLAVNPAFFAERYIITALGAMAKTFDAGATWTELGNPADSSSASAPTGQITHPYANWQLTFSRVAPSFTFAIDPRNPATLYFTRNDALFSSLNGGFSWRRLTTLITGQGMALGGIAASPGREGTIFVTAGTDFYQSMDSGASWSVKTISAGFSLKKIFVHPRKPEIIFVTTSR